MLNIVPPPQRALNFWPFSNKTSLTLHQMRAALASILIIALLQGAGPAFGQAAPVNVVRNDLGGSIPARLEMITQLRNAGHRIEIRGNCASACTMYLGLPNTCVARNARLGFHGPSSQYYGISLSPREFDYWSKVMADHYPGALRNWFMTTARHTTMGIITITGAEAIRLGARACA